jgi:hypothetical protein
MSVATRRRPLPALAFLLALSILTGIVWWRVLHRAESSTGTASNPTPSQSARCRPGSKAVKLPSPASVTVTVLNGAGREQLAGKVSAQLKSRGFTTGTPGNAPAQTGVAEIRYGTPGRAGATLLSFYLPGAKLAAGSRRDAKIEVVLGSGFQSLASAATVSRSVASASKSC